MTAVAGTIFEHMPKEAVDEECTDLLTAKGIRVERIVSTGQANPSGF